MIGWDAPERTRQSWEIFTQYSGSTSKLDIESKRSPTDWSIQVIKKIISSSLNKRASKTSGNHDALCSGWWLEVGTASPPCIDFYGPFEDKAKAETAKQEFFRKPKKASPIIFSYSKFCQPRQRTLTEKDFTIQDLEDCPPTFFEALLIGPRIY